MKRKKMHSGMFLLIGLFLLTTNIFSQDPNFYIFLCFGQSNMEGQGTIESQDQTVDSRFRVMEAVTCSNLGRTMGSWSSATPPLCRCSTGLCPADYFGRTLVTSLPANIKIGVINVSVAGCKIELFDKNNYQAYVATAPSWMVSIINEYGGNPYARLVQIAKLAQKDGVIKGILLHQGESNVGDNAWASKVKGVYNNLLTDLGLNATNVPLLAGEVVNADQGGASAGANSLIDALPQTISTSYVISSSGIPAVSDHLHFTSAGYRELGKRYATKMISLLGTNTPVTGVSVSPTTASVNIGATSQLTATVSPSNATNKSVTWSTSSSAIATVSSTGLVTGVASGAATITVTTVDGAKTATATITVNNISPVSVTGVTVSPTTASINVGATSQLTATVSPSNATNKSVTWSTSSSAIATVSSTGLVTGVASGAATITVTTVDGAKTATATITVNNIPPVSVTGVSVSPTTASVNVGATSQLTATVSPSNATNKSVTWSTSSSAIATVSSTGLVTGVATGAATITVTTVDGAKTATCAVTVTSNNGPCTFGTPTAAALPSDAKSYNYVYVLGTGGPNLSNVSNFTINWDLPNKGLYQFSMNTKDGKPNWYVDLRTGATQTFASAQPAITLSGTGFTGLDGGYNATVYNGDFVLVSKTGSFTIYFSNSATAPTCVKSAEVVLSAAGIENNEVSLYPNPFNVSLNLAISRPELVNNVFVVDQMGRVISRLEKSQISSMNVIGSKLPAGIYFIKIVSSDNANTYQVIKR